MDKAQWERWEAQVALRRKLKPQRPASMREWALQLILQLMSMPTDELQAYHDKLKAKLNK